MSREVPRVELQGQESNNQIKSDFIENVVEAIPSLNDLYGQPGQL